MSDQISLNKPQLLEILQETYEAGFKKCSESLGFIQPYISLTQAYKMYGRKTVNRWVNEELIKLIKDGTGSSKFRIKREEIELVASISNRANWFDNHE